MKNVGLGLIFCFTQINHMKSFFAFTLVLSFISLLSCTPNGYPDQSGYNSQPGLSQANVNDPITQSLFQDGSSTISEEDIQRLLDGQIQFPDSARLALYKISASSNSMHRYYTYQTNNEELLKWQQNQIETLSETIGSSNKIQKVMLMPSLLTHPYPNLTNLRESAVRMQADLLLIFSVKSDLYYKYRAFKKDQAKAFATVETVLLDIRTGVAPYSNIITREQLIQKTGLDLNLAEMQKRAENEAIILALEASGDALVEHLAKMN